MKDTPEGEHKIELVTLLPGYVCGNYITGGESSSPALIKSILAGGLNFVPRIGFACVDIEAVV